MEAVAVARGVGKAFDGRRALADVDLEIRPGEVLGLIGPNGGGKSTLLLLLAGLVAPDAGTVTVIGVPAAELAARGGGTVGLITAEPGLYPLLTGRENLRFFAGLYGLAPADVDRRAEALLGEVGLGDALDARSGGYSSGMRQKVSLARALLLEPRLLLLDEPTANLDPLSSRAIHEVVRRRADAGVAVVLATHALHDAEAICDRVAVVAGGIRRLETLPGDRRPPDPGRLYRWYAESAP